MLFNNYFMIIGFILPVFSTCDVWYLCVCVFGFFLSLFTLLSDNSPLSIMLFKLSTLRCSCTMALVIFLYEFSVRLLKWSSCAQQHWCNLTLVIQSCILESTFTLHTICPLKMEFLQGNIYSYQPPILFTFRRYLWLHILPNYYDKMMPFYLIIWLGGHLYEITDWWRAYWQTHFMWLRRS